MSQTEAFAEARNRLRAHIQALIAEGRVSRFEEALTHASFANETGAPDNQRLEFLGDAVLGLCVSELLAQANPTADEGKLTRMRSALVNTEALAAWARRVDVGACIALGRGATLGTEREQSNVLADATEALVAAVYESHGLAGARAVVGDIVRDGVAKADALATPDPKSALQERVQAEGQPAPTYRVVETRGSGPDTIFEVEVVLAGCALSRGQGRNKRTAERAAATAALEKLASGEPLP